MLRQTRHTIYMSTTLDIPAHQPFSSTLASHILQATPAHGPDLQNIHILLPNALAARQLRRALIQQSRSALLGPHISNLAQWINNHIPIADEQLTLLSESGRQLILFAALKQHRQLFKENNLWQICHSLLQFFDELSQNNFQLERYSQAQWQKQLQQAYGIADDNHSELQHLSYEARMVYTLWQAWQQQTSAMQKIDSHALYQLRLQQNIPALFTANQFYITGFAQLTPAEQQWCLQLETTHSVVYVQQINQPATNNFAQFMHNALSPTPPPAATTSVPDNSVSIFTAHHAETEARAIHMQTRLWLADNKTRIAIVSENRKLMRRVRALMERSNIVVEDTAGWSIATTSAAACVERWLQCIEQDFAWQPLLDLLKSPFFCAAEQRADHLRNVYRLEQDIIIYEQISANLQRYQRALQQRHARLQHWHTDTYHQLLQLLDTLAQASTAIQNLRHCTTAIASEQYINCIMNSLDTLGISQQLAADAAGEIVLQQLHVMQLASQQLPCDMSWQDFRAWLGASLEQQPFTPKSKPSTVHLLNLKQAEYCEFDAVIIASATADALPGRPTQTPFFNQSVRRALQLKTWTDEKAAAFLRYQYLLQAAPLRLITYQSEQNGEWLQASPWVQSLADYAQHTLHINLHDQNLQHLLRTEQLQDSARQHAVAAQTQPSPIASRALQPQRWSVSSYQRIVDCPYKFFSADVLSLKPEDHITKELLRSEYGEKIHETLRAFFEQRPGLPAPFAQRVTELNRQQASPHLLAIAQQIFSRDIENNVQHQGWLQQWQATTETFIDWLIARQQDWTFQQAEVSAECVIDEFTRLSGRLDLVESSPHGLAIIDYKSGASPSKKAVLDGENVQLTSYALLLDQVTQVGFLKLDKTKTGFSAELSNADLAQLSARNFSRLRDITQQIRDGQGLTAWGDKQTCDYCEMAGICRKQIWQANT